MVIDHATMSKLFVLGVLVLVFYGGPIHRKNVRMMY